MLSTVLTLEHKGELGLISFIIGTPRWTHDSIILLHVPLDGEDGSDEIHVYMSA